MVGRHRLRTVWWLAEWVVWYGIFFSVLVIRTLARRLSPLPVVPHPEERQIHLFALFICALSFNSLSKKGSHPSNCRQSKKRNTTTTTMISNSSVIPTLHGGQISLDRIKAATHTSNRRTKIVCTIGPGTFHNDEGLCSDLWADDASVFFFSSPDDLVLFCFFYCRRHSLLEQGEHWHSHGCWYECGSFQLFTW